MSECIFCRIIQGSIPSTKVYEDERCLAFLDINPQAPYHVILVPKEHIASLAQVQACDQELLGHLMLCCSKIAKEAGLDKKGYRVASNVGEHGAQSVEHLHIHILGGGQLGATLA